MGIIGYIIRSLLYVISPPLIFSLVSMSLVAVYGIAYYIWYTKPRSDKAKEIGGYYYSSDVNISKQGFSIKKMDDLEKKRPFDAIIIGSGISGLTTAALLSRRGWKVLCVEQHDIAGGCTHSFEERGFQFDTGLHYVGGDIANKKSMFGYLFDMICMGQLVWKPMQPAFDICGVSKSLQKESKKNYNVESEKENEKENHIVLQCTNSLKSFQDELIHLFPNEKDNILMYIRLLQWSDLIPPILVLLKTTPMWLCKILRKIVNSWISPFVSLTTSQVIGTITKNKTLAGCLSWCWADYGLPPSESVYLMNALLTLHFVNGGAFYPIGGPSNIARNIIPVIEANGGKVLVRAPVSYIILDNSGKKAMGVHIRGRDIFSKVIISAAGVMNTYGYMLSSTPNLTSPIVEKVKSCLRLNSNSNGNSNATTTTTTVNKSLSPSCAMFAVFVGLEGNPRELGLSAQNFWIYPRWDHDVTSKKYDASVQDIRKYISNSNKSIDKNTDKTTDMEDFCIEKAVDYELPVVFISSSTAKDLSEENQKKASIEILTVVDYESFEALDNEKNNTKPGHRSTRYIDAKSVLEKKLVKIMKEVFPNINDDHIKHVSSGSPLTSNFYYGTHHGEVYGLAHDCNRFDEKFDHILRPKQQIQGLYLTGQDIFCDGIAGGLMAGVMTSICIDPAVLIDLFITYVLEYL